MARDKSRWHRYVADLAGAPLEKEAVGNHLSWPCALREPLVPEAIRELPGLYQTRADLKASH